MDFSAEEFAGKIQESNWRARSDAYTSLKTFISTGDISEDFFTEHASYLPKLASEDNVPALDKALDAVLVFLAHCPPHIYLPFTNEISNGIVARAFVAKPTVQEKGVNVLSTIFTSGGHDQVVDAMIATFPHKLVKVVLQSIVTLRVSIEKADVTRKTLLSVVDSIPKLFENADASVRKEAVRLCAEINRKDSSCVSRLKPHVRPMQWKDIEDEIGSVEPVERDTPAENVAVVGGEKVVAEQSASSHSEETREIDDGASVGSTASEETAESSEAGESIAFEDAVPEDLGSLLPPSWLDQVNSKSWKDKKEALTSFCSIADVPRISGSSVLGFLPSLLKLVKSDPNVLVVAEAVKAIQTLARSVREELAPECPHIVEALLSKFKEKKQIVLDSIMECLGSLFEHVCSLAEVKDELQKAVLDRNPSICRQTLLVMDHVSRKHLRLSLLDEWKSLVSLYCEASNHANGEVRDAGLQCLGGIVGIIGRDVVTPHLSSLDKIKMNRVEENVDESLGVLIKKKKEAMMKKKRPSKKPQFQKKPSAPGLSDSTETMKKKKKNEKNEAETVEDRRKDSQSPPIVAATKKAAKPVAPTKTLAVPSGRAQPSALPAGGEIDPRRKEEMMKLEVPDGDALPRSIVKGLEASDWKDRVEALNILLDFIGVPENMSKWDPETVFQFLASKPGFKDRNINIGNALFQVIRRVAEVHSEFSKRVAVIPMSALVEKLGENKLIPVVSSCLTSFAEKCGLSFVFSHMFKKCVKARNPKVHIESLNWMHQAILDFGVAAASLQELIKFLLVSLESTNPGVKNSSVAVIALLSRYVGSKILSAFKDIKPVLMSTIESECKKVESQPAPLPCRMCAGADGPSGGGALDFNDAEGKDSESEITDDESVSELETVIEIPATDISGDINSKLLAKMQDTNWKVRLEGLEDIEGVIKAAKDRILVTGLDGLMGSLKLLLTDSNRRVFMATLGLVKHLCDCLKKNMERFGKIILPPAMSNLSDQRKPNRDAVLEVMEVWCSNVSFESLVIHIPRLLSTPSPVCREELLSFVLKHIVEYHKQGLAAFDFLEAVVSCLMDRNREVRHHAEEMYAELVQHVDLNLVNRAIRDLKPAELKGIRPVLDKCMSTVGNRMSTGAETGSSVTPISSALEGIDVQGVQEEKKRKGPRRVKKKVSDENHTAKLTKVEKKRPGSRLRLKRAASAPPRTPTKADPAIPSTSGATSQDGVMTKGYLFRVNDQKDAREKKEQWKRWAFEEPREEFVDLLREQMGACVSDELLEKMFSSKFKDHVDAIDFLSSTCTEEYYSVLLQCLDCVLKWISLRLFDMNTAPVLRATQYLLNLFSLLHDMGYSLSTYEADVIFPYIAEKCGSNNTAIRENMRLILRKGMEVVPPVKLTVILARHLRTKNFRSRIEIMDAIQDCIFAFGQDVLLAPSLSKLLPAIARYLEDRDSSVRDAAVRVFVAAHSHLDDELFDQVKFPEKVADSVTDKVKKDSAALKDASKTSTESRQTPSAMVSPLGKHSHPRPGNLVFKHRRKVFGEKSDETSSTFVEAEQAFRLELEMLEQKTDSTVTEVHTPTLPASSTAHLAVSSSRSNGGRCGEDDDSILGDGRSLPERRPGTAPAFSSSRVITSVGEDHASLPHSFGVTATPSLPSRHPFAEVDTYDDCIDDLLKIASDEMMGLSNDPCDDEERIESLKKIISYMPREDTKDVSPSILDETLSATLGVCIMCFGRTELNGRLCRCGLSAIMQIFMRHVVAAKVSSEILKRTIHETLVRLLDARVKVVDEAEGLQLLKTLNTVMLKILTHADRSTAFSSLLELLRDEKSLGPIPRIPDFDHDKYVELVVKCLIKLTRQVADFVKLKRLDAEQVLRDCHSFFTMHPPSEANESNMPLRTVKTLVHELVKAVGPSVEETVKNIGIPEENILRQYIHLLLEADRKSAGEDVSSLGESGELRSSLSSVSSLSTSGEKGEDVAHEKEMGDGQSTTQEKVIVGSEGDVIGSIDESNETDYDDEGQADESEVLQSLHEELEGIFSRIGNKDTVQSGLLELHYFRKTHPHMGIKPYMSRCSPPFQQYIRMQLQRISQKEKRQFKQERPSTAPAGRPRRDLDSVLDQRTELMEVRGGRSKELEDKHSAEEEEREQKRSELARDGPSIASEDWIKRLRLIEQRMGMEASATPETLQKSQPVLEKDENAEKVVRELEMQHEHRGRLEDTTISTAPTTKQEKKVEPLEPIAGDIGMEEMHERLRSVTSNAPSSTVSSSSGGVDAADSASWSEAGARATLEDLRARLQQLRR
eukprot:TRINITY_DN524_c0_g2_i1.p1 TRINITY_DN524_c0_g2~~TRINITY_DN524_c0_g2_i1.p1  ORF type:complete len:2291 (+),score=701.70 TRINITY_DN524_c0_g2_i1:70-6942(+)